MYYSYSYTNIGKKRLKNQDRVSVNGKVLSENEHYVLEFLDKPKSYFIIADGMGGTTNGEVAAEMVVNYFKDHDVSFNERALNIALSIVNEEVVDYSINELDGDSSGSTVVGMFILKEEALVFNAGDSLVYSFENGSFTELSIPHNNGTYEAKMKSSRMYINPAALLEFIGNKRRNQFFPYNIFKRRIKKGEVLFLSTDGVTHYYPEPEVLARLFQKEKDIEKCAQIIIDHILSTVAHDNFSFTIVVKTS